MCYILQKQVEKDSLYEKSQCVNLKETMFCFYFTGGYTKCRDI